MSMTILEEICEAEQREQELAASAKKIGNKIQQSIASKADEQKFLTKQLSQKRRLLEEAQREGLDAAPLAKTITDLESKALQLAAEIDTLQQEYDKSVNISLLDFTREKNLAEILSKFFACERAVPVASLDSCWPLMPTEVSKWDPAGRPVECVVHLGESTTKSVALTGNDRQFSRRFKPPALAWLPEVAIDETSNSETASNDKRPDFLAFRLPDRRLILTGTKLSWREEYSKPPQRYGDQKTVAYRTREEDFSDTAGSLVAEFDKCIEAIGGHLDLTQSAGMPLLDHLRNMVLSKTTIEPRFEPCTEEPTSQEVFEQIKDHWQAFVRAPWSSKLSGKLVR